MTVKKLFVAMYLIVGVNSTQLLAAEKTIINGNNKITGSRLEVNNEKRHGNVTIITRDEILLSGMQTVSDVLRYSHVNSFGSFRERSGTSGGQAALINMRGLGASRNIVLINGRRIPGSALFSTSSVNINAVPLISVDRIEILTTGGSSIYGADAIAGVINIVLRDDYEGAELEIGIARPERSGGDEEHANFVVGVSSDKGNMVFAAEFFRRDPVFDRDRDFSGVQVLQQGGNFGSDTVGISVGGNTGFTTDFGSAFVIGDCQTTDQGGPYAGVFTSPFGVPGEGCGFGYADISAMTGDVNRFNTFLSANYEINENHTIYFQNTLAKIQSYGRFAPAVGFFFVPETAPGNNFGQDIFLFHRFVAHGPRQEDYVEFDSDNVIGMNGVIWDDQVNYDAYFRSYSSTISNLGNTYINQPAVEAAIIDGSYNYINPFENSPEALAAVGHTTSRDLRVRYNEAAVNFNGDAYELSVGMINWAAGVEWSTEDYQDTYDILREAGNVLGSAGSSNSGSRERFSVFGELAIPLLESLDMKLATRYDDYIDFGDNLSPSAAFRWQPLGSLIVRASYSEGFKTPNFIQLNSARNEVLINAVGSQFIVTTGGNLDLEPEESKSYDLSVDWMPLENLTIGINYFDTSIDSIIANLGASTLLNFERQGIELPPGTSIIRDPGANGNIIAINSGFANIASLDISGFDAKIDYSYNTINFGVFSVAFKYTKLLDYIFTALPQPLGSPVEQLNRSFSPDDRATLNVTWNYADHSIALNSYWISSTQNVFGESDSGISSFTNHNLTYVYHAKWDADISVGIRNLSDRNPSIDPIQGWTRNQEINLYDVYGRVPFITYKQRF